MEFVNRNGAEIVLGTVFTLVLSPNVVELRYPGSLLLLP